MDHVHASRPGFQVPDRRKGSSRVSSDRRNQTVSAAPPEKAPDSTQPPISRYSPADQQRYKRLFLRGTNLSPPGTRLQSCLAGSKQSILVDFLGRPAGATMEELREALAGGRKSWAESTVRAGFGWDLKNKGYGVRSEFDANGVERFHLVVPDGQVIPPHAPAKKNRKL